MSDTLLQSIRVNGEIPRHVAVIMDGNGRWANERGLPRHQGHRAGMTAVRETIEGAVEVGIETLTLFAFSTENWQRPRTEISALMGILKLYAQKEKRALQKQGVEVHVLGEVERLDDSTLSAVRGVVDGTAGGTSLRLNLMISYSGRGEIVHAARTLAERVARGEIDPGQIDHTAFEGELITRGLPDPDLLIRTSGEYRLSNFMLWQLAYTELHVTQVLWPDFTREHLFEAVADYQRRERRFGRVTATAQP